MLIRDSTWDNIRERFTEEEKKILRAHITGETICPKGITVDTQSLPQGILEKLRK